MSIYADRRNGKLNGWFRVEVTADGRRARGRARTYAEAEVLESQLIQKLQTPGLFVADQRERAVSQVVTLRQLIERAKGHVWRGQKSEARVWRGYIEPLAVLLGNDTPLIALTTERMDALREELTDRGYGPAYINRFLAALCTLLKWARKRKLLLVLPDFPWQEEPPGRTRTLTYQEEAEVYAWFEQRGHHKLADFLRVLILTGMRRMENFKLRPQDIVGQYARLYDTKNGDVRSVALVPEARDILLKRLPWRFSLSRLSALWLEMRSDIGLGFDREFVIHSLRHTFGTRMVDAGIPLNVIQPALGHRDIRSTQRYAHVRQDVVMSAVLKMAENRGGAGGADGPTGSPSASPRDLAEPADILEGPWLKVA